MSSVSEFEQALKNPTHNTLDVWVKYLEFAGRTRLPAYVSLCERAFAYIVTPNALSKRDLSTDPRVVTIISKLAECSTADKATKPFHKVYTLNRDISVAAFWSGWAKWTYKEKQQVDIQQAIKICKRGLTLDQLDDRASLERLMHEYQTELHRPDNAAAASSRAPSHNAPKPSIAPPLATRCSSSYEDKENERRGGGSTLSDTRKSHASEHSRGVSRLDSTGQSGGGLILEELEKMMREISRQHQAELTKLVHMSEQQQRQLDEQRQEVHHIRQYVERIQQSTESSETHMHALIENLDKKIVCLSKDTQISLTQIDAKCQQTIDMCNRIQQSSLHTGSLPRPEGATVDVTEPSFESASFLHSPNPPVSRPTPKYPQPTSAASSQQRLPMTGLQQRQLNATEDTMQLTHMCNETQFQPEPLRPHTHHAPKPKSGAAAAAGPLQIVPDVWPDSPARPDKPAFEIPAVSSPPVPENDPENGGGGTRRKKPALTHSQPVKGIRLRETEPPRCESPDEEEMSKNTKFLEKIKNRDSIALMQRSHKLPLAKTTTTTSTPFMTDDCGPPDCNISIIQRDSPLLTIAESSGVADRTMCDDQHDDSPRKLASAGVPLYDKRDLAQISDPFAEESIEMFWKFLSIPRAHLHRYKVFDTPIPDWESGAGDNPHEISLAQDVNFQPGELIDTGRFGRVFRMTDAEGNVYAAKLQCPAFPWEYYCLLVVNDRIRKLNLSFSLTENVQQPRSFYEFSDGGMLASKLYTTCTMLQFQHRLATEGTPLSEPQLIFLLVEFILILENLHKCDIIHADLKPDNIIMRRPTFTPSTKDGFFNKELGFLVLIDFGRAIDLSVFPKNHKFTSAAAASSFKCTQMLEGAPWSYELDVFCMAACIHTLMFGKYMTNMVKEKETGIYKLYESPKRSFNRSLWTRFFHSVMNESYSTSMLVNIRSAFTHYLFTSFSDEALASDHTHLASLVFEP